MSEEFDTIIIGAGMSGLAAGIRLAYYDQRVCILERHTTIGGLNSFYRMNRRDHDVGLHAVTNYTEKGARKGPLSRILRQLRFKWDDFALAQQKGSSIVFPGARLEFDNRIETLIESVASVFPGQQDSMRNLIESITDYDDLDQSAFEISARQHLEELISEPMLREMLMCPLMWYGNPREHDMAWGQFCIMFRSIFLEGFARPYKGVRLILKHLVKKFRGLGGKLMLRTGVQQILTDGNHAMGVRLDDGRELTAKRILSSAGLVETLRMVDSTSEPDPGMAGQMSFIEAISVLDRQPESIGFDRTIVFFNESEKFRWSPPESDLCDLSTGVICSPNNYLYDPEDGELPEGVIRVTAIASYDRWNGLNPEEYSRAKLRWYDRTMQSCVRYMPEFRQHVVDTDMFTPTTIKRFTWHDNGAVYGAPDKKLDGSTHIDNLFLCGTDQGFVGIVGAMMSGISMANMHCLKD
jgi:phytoene dehydrogenase-like protein